MYCIGQKIPVFGFFLNFDSTSLSTVTHSLLVLWMTGGKGDFLWYLESWDLLSKHPTSKIFFPLSSAMFHLVNDTQLQWPMSHWLSLNKENTKSYSVTAAFCCRADWDCKWCLFNYWRTDIAMPLNDVLRWGEKNTLPDCNDLKDYLKNQHNLTKLKRRQFWKLHNARNGLFL